MAVSSPALGAYKQVMPLRGMQAMEAQSDFKSLPILRVRVRGGKMTD